MGRRKNLKKDACWNYCKSVDGNRMHIQCNFCNHIMWGGVTRLKHRFAGTHKDVDVCNDCPSNLVEHYKKMLKKHFEEEVRDEGGSVEVGDQVGEKRRRSTMDGFVIRSDKRSRAAKKLKQITMNTMAKDRIPPCRALMRMIYVESLPLSLVKSPYFKEAIEECIKYGLGLKLPTYHEARVTFLRQEVEDVHSMLERYKKEWKKTGCTLMSDGWTDGRSRSITNFLVNSPMGTVFLKSIDSSGYFKDAQKMFELIDGVIEEIGEEHVVQVITDGASAYVRAGELLMEKRKKLFWNPCAAHCMDLILEDIGDLPIFRDTIRKAKQVCTFIYSHTWVLNLFREQKGQRELKRPGITRFATCFLTLESFEKNKVSLKTLFGCKKWLESNFARNYEGKKAEETTVKDERFWKAIKYCLKATEPLVKVLKLVDGDVKPAMGYIYEALDRAKEEIAKNFDNKEAKYKKIWEVVDQRWALQLHRPLHAAAYYLNPKFHYSNNFHVDEEVQRGLIQTIERMNPDPLVRFKIDEQLEKFKRAEGTFGSAMAIHARDKKQPAHWWAMNGEGGELKQFAIRVLSLTCSATGCERNWSVFDQMHSKRRTRLEHERLNNLVFVKYNLKLERRQRERVNEDGHYDPISLSDMESDDEWVTEKEIPTLQNEDFSWMDISECLKEVEPGTSKKKRGPRDLRFDKKKDDKKKDGIKGKGKQIVVEEDDEEPDMEDETETEEDEDIVIEVIDGIASDGDSSGNNSSDNNDGDDDLEGIDA